MQDKMNHFPQKNNPHSYLNR